MAQGIFSVFLMSNLSIDPRIQQYQQLCDWIDFSAKRARCVLSGEEPLTAEAYESLYNALTDLADWYRIETIYD